MKKKLLLFGLGTALLLSPTSTFANENNQNNTGALLNITISEDEKVKNDKMTKERDKVMEAWAKDEEKKVKAKKALSSNEAGTYADPDGLYYSIPMTNYKQERTYWCGPAAARQALSFHKSKTGSSTALPSQTTLSSRIGTEAAGASSSTGIRDALNYYKGTYNFSANPYGVANVTGLSNPVATFESRVKYVLSNKINAPVLLIDSRYLPRYKGHYVRHYNTTSAYAYEYASGSKELKDLDPHYSDTYYGAHWDPMGSTTSNGIFRAVYMADVNGSNYAMVY